VEGRRERRTDEARADAAAVDHRDGELRLKAHVVQRADVAQEREGLGVAAEQDVLTVVDELARVAVRKRRRATAEPRARSSTRTRAPCRVNRAAALKPANPAPITATSYRIMSAAIG
jgi:hypothetical protein